MMLVVFRDLEARLRRACAEKAFGAAGAPSREWSSDMAATVALLAETAALPTVADVRGLVDPLADSALARASGGPVPARGDGPQPPESRGRASSSIAAPPRRARIAARFETMVDAGGLEEARRLEGLDPGLPAAKLLGLRPLQALAAGTLTREEALDAAITGTRQFAKRQMTWFRHRMPHYIWFDPLVSNLITQFRQNSA